MSKFLLTWMLILAQGSIFSGAQIKPEDAGYKATPELSRPLPFRSGETLNYEVSASKLIFSGTVGEIKLTVSKAPDANKQGPIELKAEANSKGFFPKLFGIKVKDRYYTVVSS